MILIDVVMMLLEEYGSFRELQLNHSRAFA